MAFMMARLTSRNGTANIQFRRRIPADLRQAIAVLPEGQRPKGWGRNEIVISLGTADRAEAKRRHAEVAADVERRFEALRSGARQLTQKEANALAGTLYRDFADTMEDNPGSADAWWRAVQANAMAEAGRFGTAPLMIGSPQQRRQGSLEERFGAFADSVLKREGMVVDSPSRTLLISAISQAMTDAALKLARNAEGDFSPDQNAKRFAPWPPPASAKSAGLTILAIFEKWAERGRTPSMVRRFRQIATSLDQFVRGKPAADISNDDIWAWAASLSEAGRDPTTINKLDLSTIRTLYRWAATPPAGRLVASNPALEVKIEAGRKRQTREKTFTEAEAGAILRAALTVQDYPKNPTQAFGRRWIPWLVAYSGARVGEIAQLRGSDVWQEAGAWVMRLTPEAGTVKGGGSRLVPIHEHVIALGFPALLAARGNGPLFYDPARRSTKVKTSQIDVRTADVVKWVRIAVPDLDPHVRPNHAWRHTWKTTAVGAGIAERVRDAIAGHEPGSVARRYETPPLSMLVEAMGRFPRYAGVREVAPKPPL